MSALAVGDRVRIERDEIDYPSKGTWPQFRGNTGTITQINGNGSEFGVVFGNVRIRPDGSLHGSDVVTWFKIYELTALAPRRDAERRSGRTESVGAR
jgi:hypothetical protein